MTPAAPRPECTAFDGWLETEGIRSPYVVHPAECWKTPHPPWFIFSAFGTWAEGDDVKAFAMEMRTPDMDPTMGSISQFGLNSIYQFSPRNVISWHYHKGSR